MRMKSSGMMPGLRRMGGMRRMRMSGPGMLGMRGRQSRRGRSRMPGLLVAGIALGTIGAMIMRRRRQQQWVAYDPGHAEMPHDGERALSQERMGTSYGGTGMGQASAAGRESTSGRVSISEESMP